MAYKTPREVKTELAEKFGLDFPTAHRILIFTFGRPYCGNKLQKKGFVVKIPGLGIISDNMKKRPHIEKRKQHLTVVQKNSKKAKKCLDF